MWLFFTVHTRNPFNTCNTCLSDYRKFKVKGRPICFNHINNSITARSCYTLIHISMLDWKQRYFIFCFTIVGKLVKLKVPLHWKKWSSPQAHNLLTWIWQMQNRDWGRWIDACVCMCARVCMCVWTNHTRCVWKPMCSVSFALNFALCTRNF